MRFRGTVQLNGKTATGILVPDEVMAELGQGKRPPVRVTINDYTYRTTVASMGGTSLFSVSADVRQRARVVAGDEVDVEIELDTQSRKVAIPVDLQQALAADPEAAQFFETLSFSHQSSYVMWVESAKKAETRQRRIPEAVRMLRERRKQR